MTRDILDSLAAARPAALDTAPDLDLEMRAAAITAQTRPGTARHRRSGFRLVLGTGVAATAATAAVAVAVAVTGTPTDAPSPADRPVTAADVLTSAAAHTGQATPASGRYRIVEETSGLVVRATAGREQFTVALSQRTQFWNPQHGGQVIWVAQSLGTSPATPQDAAAIRRAGSPDQYRMYLPGLDGGKSKMIPVAPGKPYVQEAGDASHAYALGDLNTTQAELDALPTDPAALRARLLRNFTGGGGDLPTDPTEWLFSIGSNLLLTLPVSQPVRAATYRMLAGLPGVRSLGSVTDRKGRRAQAVAFTSAQGDTGPVESRLLVDPTTGATLGRESRYLKPAGHAAWAAPGTLFSWEVVANRYTDEEPPAVTPTPSR